MKQIQRSSIILCMVSIALVLKAIQNKNSMMIVVALFLLVLAMGRFVMMKKLMVEDLESYDENTDFIHRYLKEDKYKEMYAIYKEGNCDVLYEENDGLLLYDHTRKFYLGSAKSLEGARDIVRLLPQDYEVFLAFEDIFERLEYKEFPLARKEKKEIIYYYSK